MNASSTLRHPVVQTRRRYLRLAGGRARGLVLLLLASVLALDTADVSMIGAIAGRLERALSLSNTELGLLAAAPSLFAALATVPVGVLSDHVKRTRLIWVSIVLWSGAMALSGFAQSFEMLLLTRMALGAATATAGPTIASLVGDFFAPAERARMYGMILSGELIGAGFGYVVSGEFASGFSWRAAFFVLAVPSLAVAAAVWRLLPEPPRGGQGWLRPGAMGFSFDRSKDPSPAVPERPYERSVVQQQVQDRGLEADPALVLRQDPVRMDLWSATRWVLRIRTNVVLIVSSALGYFYLSGIQTFGLVFLRARYGLSQSAATALLALLGLGALAGVLLGGRWADRLVARGQINGRILVGAFGSVIAALLFVPALLLRSLVMAMPLYILAAVAFAARNPVLDAARLDILHHRLWGRAEAVRTVLRRVLVASAAVVFGFMADALGSGGAAGRDQHGFGAHASTSGLQATFLILLSTLLVGGAITFWARRTYPRDVASAVASERQTTSATQERHGH